jgi:hypothetical protein
VGDLLSTCHDPDLVNGPDLWTQPAVNAEDGAINDGGQYQEVENLAACLPYRGVSVLLLALFVKSVNLSDLPRLVVSSYKDNPIWVPDSQC